MALVITMCIVLVEMAFQRQDIALPALGEREYGQVIAHIFGVSSVVRVLWLIMWNKSHLDAMRS